MPALSSCMASLVHLRCNNCSFHEPVTGGVLTCTYVCLCTAPPSGLQIYIWHIKHNLTELKIQYVLNVD